MWKFSITTRRRTTPSLCSYVATHYCAYIPYYSSVGYRIVCCCYRSFHNLLLDKRKSSPHFLYALNCHFGGEWQKHTKTMTTQTLNYLSVPSIEERLKQIIDTSYKLLCNKIVSGNIVVDNEASLQMQLGVILKQIGQLYEFGKNDHFTVDLETWQDISSTSKSNKGRARCDIYLKYTSETETKEAAIELKYFKYSPNEAVTDNRFSLLLDIENLEQYRSNNSSLLCYEIVYTDNENYTKLDNRSKIKITPTISGNTEPYAGRTITLQKSYSSIWDSYAKEHHFLKIDLQ